MLHDDVIKGNIFRVTGHLWGDPSVTGGFPSHRPVTRSVDDFLFVPKQKVEQIIGTPECWNAIALIVAPL